MFEKVTYDFCLEPRAFVHKPTGLNLCRLHKEKMTKK